ncbi:MAG: hypothetical protein JWR52_1167 [Marmoricola sp.]|nr:hypothetical protein [Marmoricola sp.]
MVDSHVSWTRPHSAARLDQIASLASPAARGQALERFVADLFRRHHFTVILDAHAAKPRQTDLIAIKLGERYLIECKWRRKPANIDDLDSLRSRMRRTTADVVGVLVSDRGFTQQVKADVRHQRHQPVLLISGAELRALNAGFHTSLPDLLYRKTEHLLRDAQVLVDGGVTPKSVRRAQSLPFPIPEHQFALTHANGTASVMEFDCGYDSPVFLNELPDIDWTSAGGAGASLDLRLGLADESDFVRALETLGDLGWLSEAGRWVIEESSRTLHGIGVRSLIECLPRWKSRCEHGTEQVAYVDQFEGGFYSLTADMMAGEVRTARAAQLSFELVGFPLDPAPLIHLSRALGVHETIHARPRTEKSVDRHWLRPLRPDLRVVGFVVTHDPYADPPSELWVVGLVVDNPYVSEQTLAEEAPLPAELSLLGDCQYLVCALRNYHRLSQKQPSYVLDRIEWARTSDRLLCRPVADWS